MAFSIEKSHFERNQITRAGKLVVFLFSGLELGALDPWIANPLLFKLMIFQLLINWFGYKLNGIF